MKLFFTLLAAALLMLAVTHESQASKGYGGYGGYGWGGGGYAGAGYGHGGHGHAGYGYGHAGYGCHNGHCGPQYYHGFHPSLYNVPRMAPPAYQAGPPTAAVTYPYYTVRGPRDFLQDACGPNPILPYRRPRTCLPSIGP